MFASHLLGCLAGLSDDDDGDDGDDDDAVVVVVVVVVVVDDDDDDVTFSRIALTRYFLFILFLDSSYVKGRSY